MEVNGSAERVPGSLIQSPESLKNSALLGEWAEMCASLTHTVPQVLFRQSVQCRRVGSTYAYDSLRLMEVGVRRMNNIDSLPASSGAEFPTDLFESRGLLEGDDGELFLGARPVGTNCIGSGLGCQDEDPRVPRGREVVVITNVTVQSGSFGVEEDEIYYKASVYARTQAPECTLLATPEHVSVLSTN
jgi:acetyl-CoA carboxylase/biotin carboxylase 1